MADAPGGTDDGGTAGFLFASDDSADGNDVVSVGGVTHSENESDRKNGEQGDQGILSGTLRDSGTRRAVLVYCCTCRRRRAATRAQTSECGGLVRMSSCRVASVTAATF